MARRIIVTGVDNCARCLGDHAEVEFTEFLLPVNDPKGTLAASHWGTCPESGDPILMRFLDRPQTPPQAAPKPFQTEERPGHFGANG